jgi:hypothetical protein
MICDGRGVPLAVRLTGANRHDSQEALPLVDATAPRRGRAAPPSSRPRVERPRVRCGGDPVRFRRLRVRYDKRADIHEALLSLGCALICWQSLRKSWMTA